MNVSELRRALAQYPANAAVHVEIDVSGTLKTVAGLSYRAAPGGGSRVVIPLGADAPRA